MANLIFVLLVLLLISLFVNYRQHKRVKIAQADIDALMVSPFKLKETYYIRDGRRFKRVQ